MHERRRPLADTALDGAIEFVSDGLGQILIDGGIRLVAELLQLILELISGI